MYSFLHQTIQELLAAIHMSRMPPDDQLQKFHAFIAKPMFDVVIQFYAGITSLQFTKTVSFLSDSVLSSFIAMNEHDISASFVMSQNVQKYVLDQLIIQGCSKEEYDMIESISETLMQFSLGDQPINETTLLSFLYGKQCNDKSVDPSVKVSKIDLCTLYLIVFWFREEASLVLEENRDYWQTACMKLTTQSCMTSVIN